MAVSANIFKKCLPAISTDIKHCGSLTICDVATATEADLASIFTNEAGEYRMMSALLMQDFEIKACGAIENGLYDFLMANKVDMSHRVGNIPIGNARFQLMPFVLAAQKSRVNNEYWNVTDGVDGPGDADWRVDVESPTGMPADIRWFNIRQRVYINSVTAGGTATHTAWRIFAEPTIVGGKVQILLKSENANSEIGATENAGKLTYPLTGLLVRGTPNVNNYEQWCEEGPGINSEKLVPFWIETVRNSMCESELYNKYREAIIDDNPYYKKFVDVPDVEKNKQLGMDWQRRFLTSFFWNKALANQDLTNYRSLEQVSTHNSSVLTIADEGQCVGFRANAVGVYEQLAECGQVKDLQGQVLNLPELHRAIYNIMRVRQANGQPTESIDLFTDSFFASKIQQAYVRYFKGKSEDTLHMIYDITKAPTKGKFGFRFSSYPLDWPATTINIITHPFFDDLVTAGGAISAPMKKASRFLWILDFSGIYPGIIATDRVVNSTGDLQARAAVDNSYMCVMKVASRKQTLTSVTYTAVVECPQASLLFENIDEGIPEHSAEYGGLDYYGDVP